MLALFAVACSSSGPACTPGVAFGPPQTIFSFADERITESSGVAASSFDANVLFTHNDSGDGARFYAIGARGQTLAQFTVAGARAWDWEDMAAGRAADGTPVLYFADIGDNADPPNRDEVIVYEVAEPRLPATRTTLPLRARYRLRYAGAPHDAEALLVDPEGRRGFGIVMKRHSGRSDVYVTPGAPSKTQTTTLRHVGRVDLEELGSGSGFGLQLLVTGGAVSPDGEHLVLRTYHEAFEWPLESFDLEDAFEHDPVRVGLGLQRQGEAITYARDGDAVIVTSEGELSDVARIPRFIRTC